MAEYEIHARIEFNGDVVIEADSPAEATEKFEAGKFNFDLPQAEMINWRATSKPKEID